MELDFDQMKRKYKSVAELQDEDYSENLRKMEKGGGFRGATPGPGPRILKFLRDSSKLTSPTLAELRPLVRPQRGHLRGP